MPDSLTYEITILALGKYDSIPISSAEFAGIRAANRFLSFALGLEEKLDMILENYAELERTLLDLALNHAIFPGKILALLDDGSNLINRRIVNFLTTTRLYLDQMKHGFSTIYGKKSETYEKAEEFTHHEYDSVLGYRVMEALRNHTQHRSLPTHGIYFPMTRDDASPHLLRYHVIPSIDVTMLEEDPEFKKSVLKELQEIAARQPIETGNKLVNILPFIRTYTESLGRIQQNLRALTATEVEKADRLIESHRTRYQEAFSCGLTGLAALSCDTQGISNDHEYLGDRTITRRKELVEKNQLLDSISERYVSSMIA